MVPLIWSFMLIKSCLLSLGLLFASFQEGELPPQKSLIEQTHLSLNRQDLHFLIWKTFIKMPIFTHIA
jgi:hypothetical protein